MYRHAVGAETWGTATGRVPFLLLASRQVFKSVRRETVEADSHNRPKPSLVQSTTPPNILLPTKGISNNGKAHICAVAIPSMPRLNSKGNMSVFHHEPCRGRSAIGMVCMFLRSDGVAIVQSLGLARASR